MSLVNWLKGMVRRPGARRRPGGPAVASFRPQVEPLGDRIVPSAGLKVLAPLGPASSAAVLMADSTCPQNTDLRVEDVLNPGGGGNGGTVNGTLAGVTVTGGTFQDVSFHSELLPEGRRHNTDTLVITTDQGKLWLQEDFIRERDGSSSGTATVLKGKGTGIFADATGSLTFTRTGGFGNPWFYTGSICLAPSD
jgi:hypothetical protein